MEILQTNFVVGNYFNINYNMVTRYQMDSLVAERVEINSCYLILSVITYIVNINQYER